MDQDCSSAGGHLSGRGAPVVSVYMGWWGGDREISGHLVAVSWEIKEGSEPGGRSWSRLEL